MMSWHGILGVTLDADYSEIRAAFKRRVLEVHPDKGGSSQEFQQVMLAFEKATSATSTSSQPHKASAARARGPLGVQPRGGDFGHERSHFRPQPKMGRGPAPSCTAQSKVAGRVPPSGRLGRSKHVLRQLHACLQRLPRDIREIALRRHLKQKHRLALEAWMTSSHKDSSHSAPAERTGQQVPCGVKIRRCRALQKDSEKVSVMISCAVRFHYECIWL